VTLADEPAPLTDAEQARLKTLVENLGSEEFAVREGATKELIALGERARPALERARDSDVPEVRFRADQVLRRLDGRNKERPFATGPKAPAVPGRPGEPRWPEGFGGRAFDDKAFEKDVQEWMRDFEKRMEELRGRFGSMPGVFGVPGAVVVAPARRHFTAEGVVLKVRPDGVRLSVNEKAGDGVHVTTVYEAKTLDAILAARPELRSHPGVSSVVEQRRKAEAEEKERAARGTAPFSFHSTTQGVTVESTPGRVKVTVTETGPDGSPVTKTYEGTDLEALKREHPELADKLGGIVLRFGGDEPFGVVPKAPGGAERRFGFEDSTDGMTGPFGLGLRARPDGKGVSVAAVRSGSDAAKLGLQTDDVILSINGTEVTVDGPTSARDLIRAAGNGPLTMEILRDGKAMTLKR
jgi:hypothetical protein